MKVKRLLIASALMASFSFSSVSQAQGIPVIDASGLVQAIQTVTQLKQQIEQAKQLYASMNGARGLGSILNNPSLRNYLPDNWQGVYDSVKSGGYNGLTSTAKVVRNANMVRDNCANKTGTTQAICYRQAAQAAQYKDFIGTALEGSSKRLNQIEGLMNQINATGDAKAIGELQARISVEQANIQNETTKMQLFKMMADAEEKLISQQQIENTSRSLQPPSRAVFKR